MLSITYQFYSGQKKFSSIVAIAPPPKPVKVATAISSAAEDLSGYEIHCIIVRFVIWHVTQDYGKLLIDLA